MSQEGPSTVERAVELAKSGSCATIADIRKALTREKYDGVNQHLNGAALKKQLVALMAERKALSGPNRAR
ncbi:hypothetical protein [Sphingomonas aerophila]|uniref:Uncharacterized protein n=1 Tax=Sphingomonas aerophila TaxID=1344948 RepID=A0A7W9ETI1_9SPHN|nr:hypothetical protein [Sphingomonas aerophila]MBB5714185.1 hypothetical protein [Sphingomonas aerophila]